MQTPVKKLIGKVIHSSFVQTVVKYKEEKDLNKLSNSGYQVNNLMSVKPEALKEIFSGKDNENDWKAYTETIKSLDLPDMTGGVNRGDQRAIFYLINHFKPDNVLEIGTHIGCSTVHIALALKNKTNKSLTTVDIFDVNDTTEKRWLNFSSKHSPAELMSMIGCSATVSFVNGDSINFFKNCKEKFDFVFLDGSHKAEMVYKEIPLALSLLNKNGLILLHDYFPGNKPIWSNASVIPGPFLAVRKIISEDENVDVIPLGELPWETKKNSRFTSLAILTKRHS
jgi:predicted O-methyltransferase YrrM